MKKFVTALLAISMMMVGSAQAESYHKVLKVLDANSFYVDFNGNHKTDSDELIHIKGINSFAGKPSDISKLQAKSFGLSENQILGVAYLGRWFARAELQNKSIGLTYDSDKNITSLTYYKKGKCKNFEQVVLQEGFATTDNKDLKQYFNQAKFKNNADIAKKFNIAYLNKYSGTILNLNDKKTQETKGLEVIDKNFFKQFYPQEKSNCKITSQFSSLKDGEIGIYFTDPTAFKRPKVGCCNDNCAVLVDMINQAKDTIKFAIYGYSGEPEVLEALVNAEKRGVKIYGIVDRDAFGYNVYHETPILLSKIKNIHTDYEVDLMMREELLKKLKSLNIEDNSEGFDIRSAIMHNKFFVVDSKYLWTGSTNVTDNCLSYNSNVSVAIKAPQVAKIYENEFNQMYFDGKYHVTKEKTNLSKTNIKLNDDTTVSVYFSPQDKAITGSIIPLINKAENYIYAPIFYLTHSGVIESLIEAKARGVDVKVIVDANSSANKYSKHHFLREKGIEVKTENWGGKMHMKSLVADDKYVVIASMNWTKAAEKANDENTIVIENKDVALKFKNEFIRLWNAIPDKWLKSEPKAESFDSLNSCFDGVDNNHNGLYDFDEYACSSVIYGKINKFYQRH